MKRKEDGLSNEEMQAIWFRTWTPIDFNAVKGKKETGGRIMEPRLQNPIPVRSPHPVKR